MGKINKDLIRDIVYPIGSIYISVSTVNPGDFIGGTWERFARGRTLVGVNGTETEFTTVEKTGGSKNLQAHSHIGQIYYSGNPSWNHEIVNYPRAVLGNNGSINSSSGYVAAGYNCYSSNVSPTNPYSKAFRMPTCESYIAGSGDSQNLQPYITVYMWKRIA